MYISLLDTAPFSYKPSFRHSLLLDSVELLSCSGTIQLNVIQLLLHASKGSLHLVLHILTKSVVLVSLQYNVIVVTGCNDLDYCMALSKHKKPCCSFCSPSVFVVVVKVV